MDSPQERDSRSPTPRKERPVSRSRSRSMPRSRSRSLPRHISPPRNRVRSRSRSMPRGRSRSRSRSLPRAISPSRNRGRSRSRSRGRSEIENPGNTLYVTGLSTRVTDKDLEAHFSKEGKVASCFLIIEPRTRESRGFAFVTMETTKDADRCIKYLNQSVLEGRYITVERSRRKRPRTPTPGHYLGLKNSRDSEDRDGRSSRGRHYERDDGYSRRRSPPPRREYSSREDRRSSPLRREYSPRDGRRSRRDRSYSRSPERRYQPRSSR